MRIPSQVVERRSRLKGVWWAVRDLNPNVLLLDQVPGQCTKEYFMQADLKTPLPRKLKKTAHLGKCLDH
jgi:hypothetical protein